MPELVGVLARQNTEIYKNLLTFMESGVTGGIQNEDLILVLRLTLVFDSR